jgi:putative ABC transport system substrate-binding protein
VTAPPGAWAYVEGQNAVFEHRFPAEQPECFKAMAAELAGLDLDVIVTSAPAASYAAKAATTKTRADDVIE